MVYEIPDSKLTKLEKQCNRIRNKGANITFNVLEPVKIQASNNDKVFTPGHKVEVEGSYKINGWEFVATIEHLDKGNIIRCINSELENKIPERYQNAPAECEHCHRIRSRKDTYLVYNTEKDEWKQVGKTCLQEYTGGLDAEVCAQIASFFAICEEGYEDDFEYGWGSGKYIDAITFKKYAYPFVKERGYHKNATVSIAFDSMNGKMDYWETLANPTKATDKELEEIDKWVETIPDDQYGYFRNGKLAWQQKYVEYRDLPLIASFIGTYFKEKSNKAKEETNRQTTNYVGNVGDKIEVNIKSIRVLYIKDNSRYSYYAVASRVYEIIDDKGNTYICDSTTDLLNAEIIKATIKGYKEYKGVKQTVLTRPKVLKEKPVEEPEKVSNGEAIRSLNDFIDYLDN